MNSNAVRWFSLIVGVLVLICGISLLFTPLEAYVMISFFVPFALLFNGIIGIILGAWFLFRPELTMAVIPYIFGLWVLFAGILRIIGSLSVKKASGSWVALFVIGIIGVLTGLFMLNHLLFSATLVAYLIAWCFVLSGIQSILFFFTSKNYVMISE